MKRHDAVALDFIKTAPEIADLELLTERFSEAAAQFGITHFACLHYARPGTPLMPRPMFGRVLPNWVARYLAEGFSYTDPGMRLLFTSSKPFTWDELKARAESKEQLHVFAAAAEEGMQDGLLVPIHGAYGDVMGMTLVSDRKLTLDRDQVVTLTALAALYATHGQTTFDLSQDIDDRPPLTMRERQCLAWAAKGKSDWEIGMILNISRKTAEVHITNAKKKLGVSNRAQAAIEAARRGWLVDEEAAGPYA